MSSTTSNSCWKSVRRNFRNGLNNIYHKFPKLPKTLPREDSLPLQIGSYITVRDYNTFLDENESVGYKFRWDRGNVYIIEMAIPEHAVAVSYLMDCFKEPNNRVKLGPINVLGQPFHYNPTRTGEKYAPDLAVCGSINHISEPIIPHPGPPPSDVKGNPHARIICEVVNAQNITDLNTKCEDWMHEGYVRCVLGIKLFPKTTIGRTVHQAMVARLWMRQASGGSVLSGNATLAVAGVHVTEWDFGTIQYNNDTPTPTGCNTLNLNAFQINIPITDAFYDPPIVWGVLTPYAVFLPGTVVGVNFVIDLFELQQAVIIKK
ncbi:hypothetical protein C1645_742889 [Glomus cerebriforme]|uniref:Restriction endonuclease domain-containing protein n=1 Tax=Glomus cerebriforme TaxID=658196 RepID=A0A397SFN6_9GLOM|nr:hypothetical protein C1645_742889 [Glomus cerebriforme]